MTYLKTSHPFRVGCFFYVRFQDLFSQKNQNLAQLILIVQNYDNVIE